MRSVDTFRGLAVAVMILGNYLARLAVTPAWFRHARPFAGLNFLDIGFPFFVFVSGLLLPGSFERRLAASGPLRTVLHFLKRYLLLVGFGICGTLLLRRHPLHDWNVLQSIGLAGLLSLPFVRVGPPFRLAVGLLLITGFQAILRSGYADWLLAHEQGDLGGVLAGLAWAGVMLIGSFLGPALASPRRALTRTLVLGLCLVGAAIAAAPFFPVTKPLATESYVLLCSGLAALGFALVLALTELTPVRFSHFSILGANPLIGYMVSGVLAEGVRSVWTPGSVALALLSGAGIYLVCFAVAWFLHARGIVVKL